MKFSVDFFAFLLFQSGLLAVCLGALKMMKMGLGCLCVQVCVD